MCCDFFSAFRSGLGAVLLHVLLPRSRSCKGALADVDTFAINPVDGGVEFVIGYSDINSNRISIKAQSGAVNMTDSIVFNANLFKELLNANKECSKATLQISDKGLAHIEFNVDDFNVKYWLVSQQV